MSWLSDSLHQLKVKKQKITKILLIYYLRYSNDKANGHCTTICNKGQYTENNVISYLRAFTVYGGARSA